MEAATARREKSLLKKKNASLLTVSARSKLLKSVNLFFANLLKSPNISTQPYLNKRINQKHTHYQSPAVNLSRNPLFLTAVLLVRLGWLLASKWACVL